MPLWRHGVQKSGSLVGTIAYLERFRFIHLETCATIINLWSRYKPPYFHNTKALHKSARNAPGRKLKYDKHTLAELFVDSMNSMPATRIIQLIWSSCNQRISVRFGTNRALWICIEFGTKSARTCRRLPRQRCSHPTRSYTDLLVLRPPHFTEIVHAVENHPIEYRSA